MSLKAATWSRSASSEPPSQPLPRRRDPMAIANLLHPTSYASSYRQHTGPQLRERLEQSQTQRDAGRTSYTYDGCSSSYRQTILRLEVNDQFGGRRDADDLSSNSSSSSPPPSHFSPSPITEYSYSPYQDTQKPYSSHNNSRNEACPSMTTASASRSSPIPRFAELMSPNSMEESPTMKRQYIPRASTSYYRTLRQDSTQIPFGTINHGRHVCTYIHPETKQPCASWQDGYTTPYDLSRHADTEHGPEEVALIDCGKLDFKSAQWVKSPEQHAQIKATMVNMVCQACGTAFASNRFDSIERHRKKGACERAQLRQREKAATATIHKKKGGKTAAKHTRR